MRSWDCMDGVTISDRCNRSLSTGNAWHPPRPESRAGPYTHLHSAPHSRRWDGNHIWSLAHLDCCLAIGILKIPVAASTIVMLLTCFFLKQRATDRMGIRAETLPGLTHVRKIL